MISIILPTYNGIEYLKKYSIPSVLKQTFNDFELIIVNDGSTDETSSFLNNLKENDNRVKIINQSNKGLATSLNKGLEACSGDYIFILEHDDIWLPNKLETQLSLLKNGTKICFCKAIEYNTDEKKFKNINNGNLSCLSFNKEISNILFPLPLERKYLGIEDGIITARMEIALAQNILTQDEILNLNQILTIMNTSTLTLSGEKNCKKMMTRYKAAINLFYKFDNIQEIKKLLTFWRKHHLFNLILYYTPFTFTKKCLYKLYKHYSDKDKEEKIKEFENKKNDQYNYLLNYRNKFN